MTWIGCVWVWVTDHATVLSAVVSAIAAIFIAIFTFTLKRSTDKLFAAANEQARTTDAALKLARHEFIATHRPKIFVLWVETAHDINSATTGAQVTYVNAGESDARIIEIGSKIGMDAPPARPTFNFDISQPKQSTMTSGEKREFAVFSDLPDEINRRISERKGDEERLYCFGYILYEDSIGTRRETGFCRSRNPDTDNWETESGCPYEYTY